MSEQPAPKLPRGAVPHPKVSLQQVQRRAGVSGERTVTLKSVQERMGL